MFGTKLYANVIMLGIAFQRGELPLSLGSLEYGIQETMGSAARGKLARLQARPQAGERRCDRRACCCHHRQGRFFLPRRRRRKIRAPQALRQERRKARPPILAARHRRARKTHPRFARHQSLLAQRIYDLIRYENLAYAEDYVARLLRVLRPRLRQLRTATPPRRPPFGIFTA